MTDIAIFAEGLGKEFRIGGERVRYRTLRDTITDTLTAPFKRARSLLKGEAYGAADLEESIWALKDVSFDVKQGEVLGIIGRNGAGKSTLLKIISRITEPSEGFVDIYGRVGALLEVGTGFHNELTGRENVQLNGAILGMTRDEIDRKFDEIVEFAGVSKFIDTPVKHYSSGMRLRLGFAVAAHLEPEILVVDEVLAVGDAAFQDKCLRKMEGVAESGRTVLFVSHNMAAVEAMCSRVMYLEQGKVVADGEASDIVSQYLATVRDLTEGSLRDRPDRRGNGRFRFVDVKFVDSDTGREVVQSGGNVDVRLEYETEDEHPVRNVHMSIFFHDTYGRAIFSCSTHFYSGFDELPARGTIVCHIDQLPLHSGRYSLVLASAVDSEIADRIENAAYCDVQSGDFFSSGRLPGRASKYGSVLVRHRWDVSSS